MAAEDTPRVFNNRFTSGPHPGPHEVPATQLPSNPASTRQAGIERDFAEMASLGFVVARWFVFGDGRSGIVHHDRGVPCGLDELFFVDLDASLEIARAVEGVRDTAEWPFRRARRSVVSARTWRDR